MAEKIKILVADDHPLFLDGIVSLLKTEKEFEILHTVTNGTEVIAALRKQTVDICILDINMPGLNGIDTTRQIRLNWPEIKIIVLTTHNEREFISEMLLAGVSGYVLKNATRTELVTAIKEVKAGKNYYSREVSDSMLHTYVRKIQIEKSSEDGIKLTAREKQIVQLLAKEYTNFRIAEELNISYRTVETHRKNIMEKTGAQNLAGLLRYAYEKGVIQS
jgi:DNA-binding NarL/FixJ family response regulator